MNQTKSELKFAWQNVPTTVGNNNVYTGKYTGLTIVNPLGNAYRQLWRKDSNTGKSLVQRR